MTASTRASPSCFTSDRPAYRAPLAGPWRARAGALGSTTLPRTQAPCLTHARPSHPTWRRLTPARWPAPSPQDLCSPTEAIFRVFITACVAARHAALGGLANALPPGSAGHEPEDGVAHVPVTPYTMLVVASAVAKTEQDLKSFPISPSASRTSSARSSPAPSPGVTPPHSPSPTPPLSRQPSLELELGSSDPSMEEESAPAASEPGRYKGLVVATAAPPSAHLSPSTSFCSLPQTPQVRACYLRP